MKKTKRGGMGWTKTISRLTHQTSTVGPPPPNPKTTHRIFAKLVESRAQFGQGTSPVVRKHGGGPAMDHRVMDLPFLLTTRGSCDVGRIRERPARRELHEGSDPIENTPHRVGGSTSCLRVRIVRRYYGGSLTVAETRVIIAVQVSEHSSLRRGEKNQIQVGKKFGFAKDESQKASRESVLYGRREQSRGA
jgi:hypothetical protein